MSIDEIGDKFAGCERHALGLDAFGVEHCELCEVSQHGLQALRFFEDPTNQYVGSSVRWNLPEERLGTKIEAGEGRPHVMRQIGYELLAHGFEVTDSRHVSAEKHCHSRHEWNRADGQDAA